MLYKDLLKEVDVADTSNFLYLMKYYFNDNLEDVVNQNEMKKLLEKAKNYPIQYIVGTANFYGYDFIVNESVLIPRFETEELVENTINYIRNNNYKKVLDLCTGSGCIGITLKKEIHDLDVTLSDISKEALLVAKENIKDLDINIIQSDLFKNIHDKYDVIISNPPYISKNEEIMDIVKNNEPSIALYAENEGLYFYEEILKNCKQHLNKEYLIAFEIGYLQKDRIVELVNKYIEDCEIVCKKDIQSRDRMIFIMNK